MDLRRVRLAEMLALFSGAVLLASLFAPWYSFGSGKCDAWTALSGSLVPFCVAGGAAIYLFVVTLIRSTPALSVAGAVWATFFGLIAVPFGLVHVLALPGGAFDRCYGCWVGFAGTVLVLVSAWLSMRDDSPRRGVRATVPSA